jgi:hypothetical protein
LTMLTALGHFSSRPLVSTFTFNEAYKDRLNSLYLKDYSEPMIMEFECLCLSPHYYDLCRALYVEEYVDILDTVSLIDSMSDSVY